MTVKKVHPWMVSDMTLRDYFAAHATAQDITAIRDAAWDNDRKKITRVDARFIYADAMMAARANHG